MSHDTEIIRALELLFQPGDVFEIRVLDAERASYRRPHVESGYFDYEHRADVPRAMAEIATAAGVYTTINPVDPALLARAANRLAVARRNQSAGVCAGARRIRAASPAARTACASARPLRHRTPPAASAARTPARTPVTGPAGHAARPAAAPATSAMSSACPPTSRRSGGGAGSSP